MKFKKKIRHKLLRFFKARWTYRLGGVECLALPLHSNQVSAQDKDALISLMKVDKVRRAICSMIKDKVLGLDGFLPLFFGRYWMII